MSRARFAHARTGGFDKQDALSVQGELECNRHNGRDSPGFRSKVLPLMDKRGSVHWPIVHNGLFDTASAVPA